MASFYTPKLKAIELDTDVSDTFQLVIIHEVPKNEVDRIAQELNDKY